MSINWTVRLKNKAFWLARIPSFFLGGPEGAGGA